MLDSINPSSPTARRDQALIALTVYAFARIGAALKMRVEDVYIQGRRSWVRLQEKGGKQHEMFCHHNVETYLHAYIDDAELAGDDKGYLFRTAQGRTGILSDRPMTQSDAWRMIRRRASQAGIFTKVGNHTPSARPASPSTYAMAASSRSRNKWRTTRALAPPASTTAATIR